MNAKTKIAITAVFVAIVVLGVFLSLPSLQNVPTQPAPQLPQTTSGSSAQPSPTTIPTATASPAHTSTPTPTPSPFPLLGPLEVTAVNGSFELTMSVEKTLYNVGETVNIKLAVTNIGNQTVNLGIDAWLFDFIVSNGTNNLIYQNTLNGALPMVIAQGQLQSGQTITNTYSWAQTYSGPNPGPAVSPGTYYIAGICNPSYGVKLQTDPIQILVLGP